MKTFSVHSLILTLFSLNLLWSTGLMAMEIQCKTQKQEFDFILKTSPESQKSYALLMSELNLESYHELLETQFQYDIGKTFEFKNEEHVISIDLIKKQGWSTLLLLPMTEKIELTYCAEYF